MLNEIERRKKVIERILIHLPELRKIKAKREDPFEILIGTILSQNTSDINSSKGMISLQKNVGVSPELLSNAKLDRIKDAIKSAGLYNIKGPRIKNVAYFVKNNFKKGFNEILSKPDSEIRKILTNIHGIGPKTSDIFLAFAVGRDIIPVDTHVNRVAKRLGFTNVSSGYEKVQKSLQLASPKGRRIHTHRSLIRLGKEICISRRPRCEICPVSDICPSDKSLGNINGDHLH